MNTVSACVMLKSKKGCSPLIGLLAACLAFVALAPSIQAQDFSDDFLRGTDPGPLTPWVVQSGVWTVTGGVLAGGTNPLFSYGFAFITNSWTDYAVQARIRLGAGAFGAGIGGRLNPATGSH